MQTDNDKIIFLWEEMKVRPSLANAMKYFVKYNLSTDKIMEKYSKSDPEYIKLLSDNQRLVHIYNKEKHKMERELAEANKYLEKHNFSKLKTKYADEIKKFFDIKTLSKEEQENLVKIYIGDEEKRKDLESRFVGTSNSWFI